MLEILWYKPLGRQGIIVPRRWIFKMVEKHRNKRLVVATGECLFTGRESCTWRNLRHGKVWIFHTHLTWFTSECRLIPPPYSSGAAGAQDPHERSAKEEETCLKRYVSFWIIFSETRKLQASAELSRRKSFIRKKKSLRILCKKNLFSNIATYERGDREKLNFRKI